MYAIIYMNSLKMPYSIILSQNNYLKFAFLPTLILIFKYFI